MNENRPENPYTSSAVQDEGIVYELCYPPVKPGTLTIKFLGNILAIEAETYSNANDPGIVAGSVLRFKDTGVEVGTINWNTGTVSIDLNIISMDYEWDVNKFNEGEQS